MSARPHKGPSFPIPRRLGPIVGALAHKDPYLSPQAVLIATPSLTLCKLLPWPSRIVTGCVGHFQQLSLLGINGLSFVAADAEEPLVEEVEAVKEASMPQGILSPPKMLDETGGRLVGTHCLYLFHLISSQILEPGSGSTQKSGQPGIGEEPQAIGIEAFVHIKALQGDLCDRIQLFSERFPSQDARNAPGFPLHHLLRCNH